MMGKDSLTGERVERDLPRPRLAEREVCNREITPQHPAANYYGRARPPVLARCPGTLRWKFYKEYDRWWNQCMKCDATRESKESIEEIELPGVATVTPATCRSCGTIFLLEQIECVPSGEMRCPFCGAMWTGELVSSLEAFLSDPFARQRSIARCIEYRREKEKHVEIRLRVLLEISKDEKASVLAPGAYVYEVRLGGKSNREWETELRFVLENLAPTDRSWKSLGSMRDPKLDGFQRHKAHWVSLRWTPLVDVQRLCRAEYVEYRRECTGDTVETLFFLYSTIARAPYVLSRLPGEYVFAFSLPPMPEGEVDQAVQEALQKVSLFDPRWKRADSADRRRTQGFLLHDFGKTFLPNAFVPLS